MVREEASGGVCRAAVAVTGVMTATASARGGRRPRRYRGRRSPLCPAPGVGMRLAPPVGEAADAGAVVGAW